MAGIAFHPHRPLLAAVGSDPGTRSDFRERLIHLYELDLDACSAGSERW
jgi:hypothetical protein